MNAVQMELRQSQNAILNSGDRVIFDTMFCNASTSTTYNQANGTFVLANLGVYLIHWWIIVAGSNVAKNTFSIYVNDTKKISTTLPSPSQETQMSGFALIDIGVAFSTVSLVNDTQGLVLLTDASVQGEIAFIELD